MKLHEESLCTEYCVVHHQLQKLLAGAVGKMHPIMKIVLAGAITPHHDGCGTCQEVRANGPYRYILTAAELTLRPFQDVRTNTFCCALRYKETGQAKPAF